MAFFSLLAKKKLDFFCFDFKKGPYISQILLKLWLIGNRTSCRPIQSVIILLIKQIGRLHNHLYDYRPNWTPLSPVTITNDIDTTAEPTQFVVGLLDPWSLCSSLKNTDFILEIFTHTLYNRWDKNKKCKSPSTTWRLWSKHPQFQEFF